MSDLKRSAKIDATGHHISHRLGRRPPELLRSGDHNRHLCTSRIFEKRKGVDTDMLGCHASLRAFVYFYRSNWSDSRSSLRASRDRSVEHWSHALDHSSLLP